MNPKRKSAATRAATAIVLIFSAVTATVAHAACPESYSFPPDAIDFYDPDPAKQRHIRGMEGNHMNENVRSLRRGQSTATASGDLRFMVNTIPNHPEALSLLVRMSLRDGKEKLPEAGQLTVECWLHRAVTFNPRDGMALMLYGTYLGRRGNVDAAIDALEKANSLRPGDVNVAYNLGLMYFEKKDYERSRRFAKEAYAGGFPLSGLKKKLEQVGQWVE